VGYLYLLIIPAAPLALILWYALVVGWGMTLRETTSTDDKSRRRNFLETWRSLKSRCTRAI